MKFSVCNNSCICFFNGEKYSKESALGGVQVVSIAEIDFFFKDIWAQRFS